ncbi:unnamed protein product [Trichogramma brassicae]|uniref:Reverse transcriptase domain-containing protein n=1 Tax=Trichogramma brassicae TaxID=86971 RepID=A0A6H5IFY3_9HYME|nr:unnamed protein product [Trichogramma brassicae]
MLFADDLQVYYSFFPHDLEIGIHRLNRDIAAVAAWATGNGLSLNVRKTKAIILASDPYYRQLDLQRVLRVALNSVELPYSTEVQCLGLWIQTGLDWSRQVDSASGRIYGALRVLRRLRRLLSRQNRKELIEALVFPHLDYACAAYDDLFNYQNIQLHRALNACVRFVIGTSGRRERVTPYRLGLGWLSVELRRRYFIASIAYTCLAQGTPSYLVKNFKLAVNSGIERFSPRLPRRSTLYYRDASSTSSFAASRQTRASEFVGPHARRMHRQCTLIYTYGSIASVKQDERSEKTRRRVVLALSFTFDL